MKKLIKRIVYGKPIKGESLGIEDIYNHRQNLFLVHWETIPKIKR